MKDNVLLILTIIAIPFTSNNLFHVKVININILQAPILNLIILIFI